jgi:Lon protease-like protein
MSTKRLLRKLELLNEIKGLEMELKDLLGNVMVGALAHALGDTQAKDKLKNFEDELARIQTRAEELQAEIETMDLLLTMGIDTQD